LLGLFLLADAVILCTGALWLKVLTGYNLPELVKIGILPFVAGDILKAAGAAAVYKYIRPCLERIF
jgi:biotin transporter BioY